MSVQIIEAARRWAQAFVDDQAQLRPHDVTAMELDDAQHELVHACGLDCPYCEPGTCPLADMPAWLDTESHVDYYGRRIADTAPL